MLSVTNKMTRPTKEKLKVGPSHQHQAPLGELRRELSHWSWKIREQRQAGYARRVSWPQGAVPEARPSSHLICRQPRSRCGAGWQQPGVLVLVPGAAWVRTGAPGCQVPPGAQSCSLRCPLGSHQFFAELCSSGHLLMFIPTSCPGAGDGATKPSCHPDDLAYLLLQPLPPPKAPVCSHRPLVQAGKEQPRLWGPSGCCHLPIIPLW